MSNTRRLGVALAVGWLAAMPLAATGRLEGRLTDRNGAGLSGVTVTVKGESTEALTDYHGTFGLALPDGTYTVTLSAAGYSETVEEVEVPFAGTVRVDRVLAWDLTTAATTNSFSASRAGEQLRLAAQPRVVVTGAEVEPHAGQGLLPKLLEFRPGVHVAQNSLYDFSVGSQGFNRPQGSRSAVRVDGRDPSQLFFGGPEWAALLLPPGEVAQAEMLRGPATLDRAPSGALVLLTRRPRESRGGSVRLTGGELGTVNGDLRWATGLGGGWYLKLLGSMRSSEDFTLSRNGAAEYSVPCAALGDTDCLPQERVALDPDDDELSSASVRLDRAAGRGGLLSIAGGFADVAGPVQQTQLGRVQVLDSQWTWARVGYARDRWRILGTYRRHEADEQRLLATGDNLALDEQAWKWEAETFWRFAEGRAQVTIGASHEDERVDSNDPDGPLRGSLLSPLNRQTLLFEAVESEADALWGRAEWRVNPQLTLTAAVRYDDSTLHDPETSPHLALVYSPAPDQIVHLWFSRAFEAPDYADYFMQAEVADRVNLAAAESICALDGVRCGFDIDFLAGEDPALDTTPDTHLLALGNRDLDLPLVDTLGVGYRAVLDDKIFFQADAYRSDHRDFVSDLLPLVGTDLGRLNFAFGPYQPPESLSDQRRAELFALLAEELGPLLPLLTNNVDGTPVVGRLAHGNFGEVEVTGVDLHARWRLADGWSLEAGYSWLDHSVDSGPPDLADRLVPNAPENRAVVAVTHARSRWSATASVRWVDDFRWAFGPFVGAVDSYATADLVADVELRENFSLGVNVANLFDEEHWESFGGDLIGRRALGHLTVHW